MSKVQENISFLGRKCVDAITEFAGVITSVSFDVSGCIQAYVVPTANNGDLKQGSWFDVSRLHISSDYVLFAPDFFHSTKQDRVDEGKSGSIDKAHK